MKIISTKLILLSSMVFMTACSTTTATLKPTKLTTPKKLTTLEIIGVTQSNIKRELIRPTVLAIAETVPAIAEIEVLPLAQTFPVIENTFQEPEENILQESALYVTDNMSVTSKIEEDAKRLLGIKYVWGATGPYKYDCSGFTQKVYRDAGINIPRVSRDQARVGQYVSFNNLQKGDMVFFDTNKKRTGKVSHVGIYLGDGNFIHASSAAKKVVVFNFNKKTFYKKRFLWGRRVIQDNYFMASL